MKLLKIGRNTYINLDNVFAFEVASETKVRVIGGASELVIEGEDARWLATKLDSFEIKAEKVAEKK